MERLLRQSVGAAELAAIALCSLLLARASGTFADAIMRRNAPAADVGVRATIGAGLRASTTFGKQVDDILGRNLFCSTCTPAAASPARSAAAAPSATSLPLRLMAIMYSPLPADRRWSMAVIRDLETNQAGPYGLGMKVRAATVVGVEETRVYLDNAGKREFLDLLDSIDRKSPAPRLTAAGPAVVSADPLAVALQKGVRKVAEHRYQVERRAVETLLDNLVALSRVVRVVPEVRDGKAIGFRLLGLKSNGPLGTLDLQNGDVVHAINGLEMTTPDGALQAYTKLKSANHLSVALERNGRRITNDYDMR